MDLTNLNKDRKNQRKAPVDLSTMVYGKIPPQAKNVEEAVLGVIMLERDALDKAMSLLQPECFYVEAHMRIFKVYMHLSMRSIPIDEITVIEELKKTEQLEMVGGPAFIVKLTANVTSGANVIHHSRIIYQKFVQREIIRVAGEMIAEGYEDSTDAFDLLDWAEHKLSSLSIKALAKPYVSLQSLAADALKNIYELKNRESSITGVPSGINKLDVITQGWQPTDLIVIAARPSVGKSAVAANLAINAAGHKEKPVPVGVFSLEMSSIQWVMRILSKESEIGLWELKRGRVNDNQVDKLSKLVFQQWTNTKIFFDDTSGLDIYQMKSKARTMVLKEGVGLLIIDYMQLISGNRSFNENREQEVSKISRELKQLAKELNVPIIALSQLSRDGDGTNPRLKNLRESGAIEQDADNVFFLIEVSEEDARQDATLKDSILIKIAKNRNGILEDVPVKFVKSIQKIMNESEYDDYETRKGLGPSFTNTKDLRLPFAEKENPF